MRPPTTVEVPQKNPKRIVELSQLLRLSSYSLLRICCGAPPWADRSREIASCHRRFDERQPKLLDAEHVRVRNGEEPPVSEIDFSSSGTPHADIAHKVDATSVIAAKRTHHRPTIAGLAIVLAVESTTRAGYGDPRTRR